MMAQTIDTEFLEKERERLTTSLAEARTNLELIKSDLFIQINLIAFRAF